MRLRRIGHPAEGRTDGHVDIDIRDFAEEGSFRDHKQTYLLSTHHVELMTPSEEEAARRAVKQKKITRGLVRNTIDPVRAGGKIEVPIIYHNSFGEHVSLPSTKHIFEMRIEPSKHCIQGQVQNGNEVFVWGDEQQGNAITKAREYTLSFHPIFSSNTNERIELCNFDRVSIEHITLHVLPERPYRLIAPARRIDAEAGVVVEPFTVKVRDQFDNECDETDIQEFDWEFTPQQNVY